MTCNKTGWSLTAWGAGLLKRDRDCMQTASYYETVVPGSKEDQQDPGPYEESVKGCDLPPLLSTH